MRETLQVNLFLEIFFGFIKLAPIGQLIYIVLSCDTLALLELYVTYYNNQYISLQRMCIRQGQKVIESCNNPLKTLAK